MLPAAALHAYAASGGLFFPYRVSFIGGRAYVAGVVGDRTDGGTEGNHGGNDDHCSLSGPPVGAELLSIDGRPIGETTALLMGFFSGTSDTQRLYFLGESFPEAMYLGYGPADRFDVEWSSASNHTAGTEEGPSPARRRANSVRGRSITENRHPTGFPILNDSPLRYRSDNSFRREGDRAIVLDFRAFENIRGGFGILLSSAFATAETEGRDMLVVDLRRNIGGGSFVAALLLSRLAEERYLLLESSDLKASAELKEHFLRYIPPFLRMLGLHRLHPWTRDLWKAEPGSSVSIRFRPQRPAKARFGGRVAFIAGPGDYSSSAILLGAVKRYGLGIIVGEPSGGYPTHYGNCTRHALPASGLEILIPASVNHGWGLAPVEPDIPAAPTRADLIVGRDRALEEARKAVRAGAK
jgi:hypothetical protein